jgi:hypothetical protein
MNHGSSGIYMYQSLRYTINLAGTNDRAGQRDFTKVAGPRDEDSIVISLSSCRFSVIEPTFRAILRIIEGTLSGKVPKTCTPCVAIVLSFIL